IPDQVRNRVPVAGSRPAVAGPASSWPAPAAGSLLQMCRGGGYVGTGRGGQVLTDALDHLVHLVGDQAHVAVDVRHQRHAGALAGGGDEEEGTIHLDDALTDPSGGELFARSTCETVQSRGDRR